MIGPIPMIDISIPPNMSMFENPKAALLNSSSTHSVATCALKNRVMSQVVKIAGKF